MTIITKKINRKRLIKLLQVSNANYVFIIMQANKPIIQIQDTVQAYRLITED